MPQRPLVAPTRSNFRHVVAAFGDSHTYNRQNSSCQPEDFYWAQYALWLQSQGCHCIGMGAGGLGFAGDTTGPTNPVDNTNTPGLITRVPLGLPMRPGYPIPDIAIIYCGTNDFGKSLGPAFTLTAFNNGSGVTVGAHDYAIADTIGGVEYLNVHKTITLGAASGVLLSGLVAPSSRVTRRRIFRSAAGTTTPMLLLADTSSTPNFTLASASYYDTTADGSLGAAFAGTVVAQLGGSSVPPMRTTWNLQTAINAVLTAGCQRVIVLNQHFLNYSDGSGDTITTQQTAASQTRIAQNAVNDATQVYNPALTAFSAANVFDPAKVIMGDLFTYFKGLIVNASSVTYGGVQYTFGGTGTSDCTPNYTNGSTGGAFSWHAADKNPHLNAMGQYALNLFLQSITPASWVTALKTP